MQDVFLIYTKISKYLLLSFMQLLRIKLFIKLMFRLKFLQKYFINLIEPMNISRRYKTFYNHFQTLNILYLSSTILFVESFVS